MSGSKFSPQSCHRTHEGFCFPEFCFLPGYSFWQFLIKISASPKDLVWLRSTSQHCPCLLHLGSNLPSGQRARIFHVLGGGPARKDKGHKAERKCRYSARAENSERDRGKGSPPPQGSRLRRRGPARSSSLCEPRAGPPQNRSSISPCSRFVGDTQIHFWFRLIYQVLKSLCFFWINVL